MKGPAPNASARRVTGRRERLTNERHYRLPLVSQAIRAVWRLEAARLLSEYRRTGNTAHLKASPSSPSTSPAASTRSSTPSSPARHQLAHRRPRRDQVLVGGNGKVTAYASVLDNQPAIRCSSRRSRSPTPATQVGRPRRRRPEQRLRQLADRHARLQRRHRRRSTPRSPSTRRTAATPKTQPPSPSPPARSASSTRPSPALFGVTNDGGAVHITTPTASRLIATARTYNQTTGGTYGQFISGVTPNEAAGVGSRPLQILQVEESTRFRSNVGLAEVTGKPVTLEISVVPPTPSSPPSPRSSCRPTSSARSARSSAASASPTPTTPESASASSKAKAASPPTPASSTCSPTTRPTYRRSSSHSLGVRRP